jgi:hypothetical protein
MRLAKPLAATLILLIIFTCSTRAQQTPAPQRTGRAYATNEPPRRSTAPARQAQSPVTFTDITARSRIGFRHLASPTSQKYLMESMGAGVALLDYDRDGRLDIYFTNGARLQDPMPKGASPEKSDARFWNRLYRQKPDGTYEDVTERAGVKGRGYAMGAAAADYDGDGFTDLYVTAYGTNQLFRNRGDGTFEDVSARTGTAASGWSTSAGWLDYNRDGRLDLFVARYMDWDFERGAIYCGEQTPEKRAYCHPDNFKGAPNILFRQKPDGTFENVSIAAGVADPDGKGLGVAFADFDSDGWTDIFVAHDSRRQALYRNTRDGKFEDVALLAGAGYDENGKTFAGMGVDIADYDNDSHPDVFVTALSNETYPLFRNNGDDSFTYETNTTGIGQISLLFSGWGTKFADFDNDGWRDLFVAQSHVLDTIERTSSYLQYKQTPLLMRNTGKGFFDISATAGAAFKTRIAARGAAFGDLDNDGDTDIIIGVTDGAPVILRNDGTRNNWIGFELTGARPNTHALGARITVTDATGRRQIADISNAGSYLASNDARALFGIGTAASIRSVEIRWTGGKTQTLTATEINRYHKITEKP